MKFITRNELTSIINTREFKVLLKESLYNVVIGGISLSSWAYLIYFLSNKSDLPKFILGVNVVCWFIFAFIYSKQVRCSFTQKKDSFLIAKHRESLIFPSNHSLKKAVSDLDLFLWIDLNEIQSAQLELKTRNILHIDESAHRSISEHPII